MRRVSAIAAVLALVITLPAHAAKASKPAKAEPAAAAAKAAAPTEAAKPAAADNGQQAAMDAMMKAAQPGPMHEKLKALEGHWKTVVKTYMAPGQPTTIEGEATYHMALGGRYLIEDTKGTFMNAPYEGQGLYAYDNLQKQFASVWIDNMGTGIMTGTGSIDDAGKVITITGTTPGMDLKPMPYRMTTTLDDANNHHMQMFGTMGGKETLMMEIAYTRAQ